MYRFNFEFLLSLAAPRAGMDVNFISLKPVIETAIISFNARFENRKEVELKNIYRDEFILELRTMALPSNPTREISALSQILVNDFGFQEFSAKQGRLFNIKTIKMPTQTPKQLVTIGEYGADILTETPAQYGYNVDNNKQSFKALHEIAATIIAQENNVDHTKIMGEMLLEMNSWVTSTDDLNELNKYKVAMQSVINLINLKIEMLKSK